MRFSLIAACMIAAAACSVSRTSAAPPPRAEFLLSSADSTFWVASTSGAVRVRGVPLLLARYDGHFYELYTADDDFSYPDALLLGARLYRRDIATGDSAMLFADTAVAHVAASYARAHPDERPLEPDEDGDANPSTTATAEVDVLDVLGPYVSYEYHLDVDLPGRRPWHTTRRAVIDLRSGRQAEVADIVGADAAHGLELSGRHFYESARDSLLATRPAVGAGDDRRATDALLGMEFDAHSFSLTELDGDPAIAFGIPGQGEGAAGHLLELEPIKARVGSWWSSVQPTLPVTDAHGDDRWNATRYRVVARYDSTGDTARVSLGDASTHEWPVVTALSPLRRIEWLDRPTISSSDRRALLRAFDAAASYDETSRVAALSTADSRLPPLTHASFQDCPRKPARVVRAHDARACEQHGQRLRRRHSVDDGQNGGHLRISAQSRQRRHGIHRSRRFSRAHSPRRSGGDEGEHQFRRTIVHGSGRSR